MKQKAQVVLDYSLYKTLYAADKVLLALWKAGITDDPKFNKVWDDAEALILAEDDDSGDEINISGNLNLSEID